jgi:proteinaceous RNase P
LAVEKIYDISKVVLMPSELLTKKRGRSFEAENQVVESVIQSAEFPESGASPEIEKDISSSTNSDNIEKKKEQVSKKKKNLTPEAAALVELKTGLTSCVPTSDFSRALLLVKDAIAAGMVPTAHFYGILLNIATRATKLEPEVMQNALHVFQHMLSTNAKVPEASYTSMIKICALASAPEEGMRLLEKMCESGVEPRLRSYVGLIEAFAQRSDLDNLKRVFEHMEKHDVAPSQTEYANLLRVLRQRDKEEEGLSLLRKCMPVVRVLEPSLANAVSYFFSNDEPKTSSLSSLSQWKCTRSFVKRATGQCSVTGRSLRSIDLSSEELHQLASKCESLACSNEGARQQFEDFKRLLSTRGPFDVIIDGANVGFYGQNHYDGGLCYSHIDAVVRHFEQQGLRVLVVMNDKWLQPRFYSNPEMRRPFKRRVNYYAARARGEDVDYQKIPRPTVIRDKGNRSIAAGSLNPSSSTSSSTTWEAPEAEIKGGEEVEALSDAIDDSIDEDGGNLDCDEFVDPEGGTSPSTYGRFSHYDCIVAATIEEDSAIAGDIIARWRSTRAVYSVPRGNNDDWFWMYAAVSQPDPKSVRLISNDYMRDHHFHVFQEWGSFQTWRERHQVKFSIQRRGGSGASSSSASSAALISPGAVPNASLQLRFPLPFSFRMQFSDDGNVWHFPLMKSVVGQAPLDGSTKVSSLNDEDAWICAERIDRRNNNKEELK